MLGFTTIVIVPEGFYQMRVCQLCGLSRLPCCKRSISSLRHRSAILLYKCKVPSSVCCCNNRHCRWGCWRGENGLRRCPGRFFRRPGEHADKELRSTPLLFFLTCTQENVCKQFTFHISSRLCNFILFQIPCSSSHRNASTKGRNYSIYL